MIFLKHAVKNGKTTYAPPNSFMAPACAKSYKREMNEGLSCSELGKIVSDWGGHATSMREPYLS